MRNVFAIVLAGAMLAACGQRGALYLPGESREQVGPTTSSATPAVPQASPIPPAATTTAPESDSESEARRRNRAN
jgi:predicted small lipoprotein YifL